MGDPEAVMKTLHWMSFTAAAMLLASTTAAGQTTAAKAKGATIDETKLEKRSRPVSCNGVETITLDGVLLRVDAVAVAATGNCKVIIKNSHVSSAGVAVQLAGTSAVTVENSIIEGAVAFQLTGDPTASVKSSTIRGGTQRLGDAKLRDLGDNIWK